MPSVTGKLHLSPKEGAPYEEYYMADDKTVGFAEGDLALFFTTQGKLYILVFLPIVYLKSIYLGRSKMSNNLNKVSSRNPGKYSN